jgi:hypothetical protein
LQRLETVAEQGILPLGAKYLNHEKKNIYANFLFQREIAATVMRRSHIADYGSRLRSDSAVTRKVK